MFSTEINYILLRQNEFFMGFLHNSFLSLCFSISLFEILFDHIFSSKIKCVLLITKFMNIMLE